jgi:hypothetical protein
VQPTVTVEKPFQTFKTFNRFAPFKTFNAEARSRFGSTSG